MVFGSLGHRGMGWRDMWCKEQGIQHVLMTIKHLRAPSHLQSLLQINLRQCTLLAACPSHLWSFLTSAFPILTARLDVTCNFLAHGRTQLCVPCLPQPP
jgi:hypothetical protein